MINLKIKERILMINFKIFKSRFYILSFFTSISTILIGFLLLSFSDVELFFSQKIWLFYLIFFSPLCIFLLFSIGMLIYIYLFFEYQRLKFSGLSMFWIGLYLLIVFIFLILMIISLPYIGRWAN